MKQTVTIIGATGSVGTAISKGLAKGNYRLLLCSDEERKLSLLVKDINKANRSAVAEAMVCSFNGSWEADIIILAVPSKDEKAIADKIRQVANQKLVISIDEPAYSALDGGLTVMGSGATGELQKLLPHSKVVKVSSEFITGSDYESVETAAALMEAAGFNPIHSGSLMQEIH